MKVHYNNRHGITAFPPTRPLYAMALLFGLIAILPVSAFSQSMALNDEVMQPSARTTEFVLLRSATNRIHEAKNVGNAQLAEYAGKYVPVHMSWNKFTSTCSRGFAPQRKRLWSVPPAVPIAPNLLAMPCWLGASVDVFRGVQQTPHTTPPSSNTETKEPPFVPVPETNPRTPTDITTEIDFKFNGPHGLGIKKHITFTLDIAYTGSVQFVRNLRVEGFVIAVAEATQNQSHHHVVANYTSAHASVGGNVGRSIEGNIDINAADGNSNAQTNSVVIPDIDAAAFVFGSVGTETHSYQAAVNNYTSGYGAYRDATLDNNALRGASGNVGVNIAVGANNGQQNSAVLAAGSGRIVTTTTSTYQNTSNNVVSNISSVASDAREGYLFDEAGNRELQLSGAETGHVANLATMSNRQAINQAAIGGHALLGATGNIGMNIAAGTGNLQSNSLSIMRVASHQHQSFQPVLMEAISL